MQASERSGVKLVREMYQIQCLTSYYIQQMYFIKGICSMLEQIKNAEEEESDPYNSWKL